MVPPRTSGTSKRESTSGTDLKILIPQLLSQIEANTDLKQLRELYIANAKEMDYGKGRNCVLIYVPVPFLKKFQAIQTKLIAELEKRLGRYVVIIAQRRILPKPSRKMKKPQKQKRPMSRTLAAVHSAILDDIVYPLEIIGKRIRTRLDGTRLYKIYLDNKPQVDDKTEVFAALYKQLTGKTVEFLFPQTTQS